jgi:hypothetical protein
MWAWLGNLSGRGSKNTEVHTRNSDVKEIQVTSEEIKNMVLESGRKVTCVIM